MIFFCAGMTKVEYKYFSTGEEITLQCKCKALYWNGPAWADTGSDISQVDKLKKWNVSIYTKGHTVSTALPEKLSRRLNVTGDNFDLHMKNLSTPDEGLYTCVCDPTGNGVVIENRYILQNKCRYI